MAKFIMLFFFSIGSWISYLTYNGIGQEVIKTLKHEKKIESSTSSGSRSSGFASSSSSSSSSSRSSRSNSRSSSFGSYNSSSYGYGK